MEGNETWWYMSRDEFAQAQENVKKTTHSELCRMDSCSFLKLLLQLFASGWNHDHDEADQMTILDLVPVKTFIQEYWQHSANEMLNEALKPTARFSRAVTKWAEDSGKQFRIASGSPQRSRSANQMVQLAELPKRLARCLSLSATPHQAGSKWVHVRVAPLRMNTVESRPPLRIDTAESRPPLRMSTVESRPPGETR